MKYGNGLICFNGVYRSIYMMKMTEVFRTMPEGQTFDRKSTRIEPKALAITMVAMVNADGGTIVPGIEEDSSVLGIDWMH